MRGAPRLSALAASAPRAARRSAEARHARRRGRAVLAVLGRGVLAVPLGLFRGSSRFASDHGGAVAPARAAPSGRSRMTLALVQILSRHGDRTRQPSRAEWRRRPGEPAPVRISPCGASRRAAPSPRTRSSSTRGARRAGTASSTSARAASNTGAMFGDGSWTDRAVAHARIRRPPPPAARDADEAHGAVAQALVRGLYPPNRNRTGIGRRPLSSSRRRRERARQTTTVRHLLRSFRLRFATAFTSRCSRTRDAVRVRWSSLRLGPRPCGGPIRVDCVDELRSVRADVHERGTPGAAAGGGGGEGEGRDGGRRGGGGDAAGRRGGGGGRGDGGRRGGRRRETCERTRREQWGNRRAATRTVGEQQGSVGFIGSARMVPPPLGFRRHLGVGAASGTHGSRSRAASRRDCGSSGGPQVVVNAPPTPGAGRSGGLPGGQARTRARRALGGGAKRRQLLPRARRDYRCTRGTTARSSRCSRCSGRLGEAAVASTVVIETWVPERRGRRRRRRRGSSIRAFDASFEDARRRAHWTRRGSRLKSALARRRDPPRRDKRGGRVRRLQRPRAGPGGVRGEPRRGRGAVLADAFRKMADARTQRITKRAR